MVCSGDGIAADDVLDLVAALVDKSILIRTGSTQGTNAWYRMLGTVREYGELKLGESGRARAAHARHVAYIARLVRWYDADSFGPRELEWIERLRRERANILAALEYSVGVPGNAGQAAAIAAGLRDFWYAAGLVGEGRRWLETVLAKEDIPATVRAKALEAGAHLAMQNGDWEATRELQVRLRALAEKHQDLTMSAGYARCSGLSRFLEGDLVGGRARLDRALEAYRRFGDERQVFTTLILLSAVTFFLQDASGARLAEEALEMCEARQANWSKMYAQWMVAIHGWRLGGHRRAAALLREIVAARLEDRTQLALAIDGLAWCAGAVGQHERAAGLLGAAQAVWALSGAQPAGAAPYRAFDDDCAARARKALGAGAFAAASDALANAGLEEVLSFALAEKTTKPRRPARRGEDAPGGLTPREREIAALVAEGLSNREMAARLVIAQRTAETHVENILAKLGFTSRTQIAAWLAEHRDSHTLRRTT